MAIEILQTDDQYVLNHCTKFIARDNKDSRHNFGQLTDDDPRSRIAESWRFPIIDSYSDGKDFVKSYSSNVVTFVYQQPGATPPTDVAIIGTFANLYEPIPLQPVNFAGEATGYYALSIVVPKAQFHTYKFIVDGKAIIDPINP
ncbi:MAG: glycogen-binding domain-containing protein [Nostoc sp.]|uniref:glycogen-binding domain-containing protein n=1 Tax=Nostoc sp. TaxID=1180 RepID=UPI002FFB6642